MFKISTIIPMCNDDKYLRECIDHIINQTIGFKENVQLILVDDCSEDKSYEIAVEYQEKYPENIIAKRLDENSGYGGKPRNLGIELATGKYLTFSDADDYFKEDAFEIMVKAMEERDADFIITNWEYMEFDGTPWEKPVFDLERFENFKLEKDDYRNSFYVMNSSMCNKMFDREFVNKNDIRCLEGVPGEDTYFSLKAFLNSDKVFYINDITYYYRQRNVQIVDSSSSWNCSKTFFDGMNYAYRKVFELFRDKKKVNLYRFFYARNMTYLLYRFVDSQQLNDEERLEVLANTRWYYALSSKIKVPAVQQSLNILIRKIVDGNYQESIEICKIINELRSYMPVSIRHSMSKPYDQMYELMINESIDDENFVE